MKKMPIGGWPGGHVGNRVYEWCARLSLSEITRIPMAAPYELLVSQLHIRLGTMEAERADVKRQLDALRVLLGNVAKMSAAAADAAAVAATTTTTTSAPCMETLVDVRAKFFVEAALDLNAPIAVHIGLGIFVAVPIDEATNFIEGRETKLNARVVELDASLGEARGHLELTEMMLQTVSLAERGGLRAK